MPIQHDLHNGDIITSLAAIHQVVFQHHPHGAWNVGGVKGNSCSFIYIEAPIGKLVMAKHRVDDSMVVSYDIGMLSYYAPASQYLLVH